MRDRSAWVGGWGEARVGKKIIRSAVLAMRACCALFTEGRRHSRQCSQCHCGIGLWSACFIV